MTATIYSALWSDVLRPGTTEDRYATSKDIWSQLGVAGLEAIANLAASLTNHAAGSSPPGSWAPAPPPEIVLSTLGDRSHHLEVGSATWNHLAGRIAAGQMDVSDPALAAEGGALAKYEADAVFWFLYMATVALKDMSGRLPDDEFDRRVGSVLDEFEID